MRKVCIILAALSTTAALGADTPQIKSGEAQKATQEAQQGNAQVQQPLHRHPTILAMLRRSNAIRRNVGLRPQRINPALTKAAQDHANYMAATGDFSHYTNGGYQYRAVKYGFRGGVRENIAAGYGSVDATFNTWQASGGHYASIVSNTSEAGFGYAISRNGSPYWVGVYGSPSAVDVAGEEEGFAEQEIAKAKAEAAKLAEEAAKSPEEPKADTPAKKTPAAGGL